MPCLQWAVQGKVGQAHLLVGVLGQLSPALQAECGEGLCMHGRGELHMCRVNAGRTCLPACVHC